jgi:hypothetical protein
MGIPYRGLIQLQPDRPLLSPGGSSVHPSLPPLSLLTSGAGEHPAQHCAPGGVGPALSPPGSLGVTNLRQALQMVAYSSAAVALRGSTGPIVADPERTSEQGGLPAPLRALHSSGAPDNSHAGLQRHLAVSRSFHAARRGSLGPTAAAAAAAAAVAAMAAAGNTALVAAPGASAIATNQAAGILARAAREAAAAKAALRASVVAATAGAAAAAAQAAAQQAVPSDIHKRPSPPLGVPATPPSRSLGPIQTSQEEPNEVAVRGERQSPLPPLVHDLEQPGDLGSCSDTAQGAEADEPAAQSAAAGTSKRQRPRRLDSVSTAVVTSCETEPSLATSGGGAALAPQILDTQQTSHALNSKDPGPDSPRFASPAGRQWPNSLFGSSSAADTVPGGAHAASPDPATVSVPSPSGRLTSSRLPNHQQLLDALTTSSWGTLLSVRQQRKAVPQRSPASMLGSSRPREVSSKEQIAAAPSASEGSPSIPPFRFAGSPELSAHGPAAVHAASQGAATQARSPGQSPPRGRQGPPGMRRTFTRVNSRLGPSGDTGGGDPSPMTSTYTNPLAEDISTPLSRLDPSSGAKISSGLHADASASGWLAPGGSRARSPLPSAIDELSPLPLKASLLCEPQPEAVPSPSGVRAQSSRSVGCVPWRLEGSSSQSPARVVGLVSGGAWAGGGPCLYTCVVSLCDAGILQQRGTKCVPVDWVPPMLAVCGSICRHPERWPLPSGRVALGQRPRGRHGPLPMPATSAKGQMPRCDYVHVQMSATQVPAWLLCAAA